MRRQAEAGGIVSKEWVPNMSGKMRGFEPEYRYDTFESADGPTFTKWKKVPWTREAFPVIGQPYPRLFGGVLDTIGLLGKAQANAIAWSFAAQQDAIGKEVEVRVVEYEIEYSIKARPHEPG